MWRDSEFRRRFPVLLALLIASSLCATAPPASADGLGAITYPDAGTNRIYAFKGLSNGRLFVHYWDGSSWSWADQGVPPGTRAIDQPSAVTYTAAGSRRIYAFVRGANGRLFVNWWNGSAWQWADQGVPPGTTAASAPNVITYLEGTQQRIYAFVRGANGRLFVNWWNGSAWQWADQGAPTGTTVADAPSVVTYQITERRIYAFVRGTNGRLFVNWWNGSRWQWADQGMPASGAVVSQPSALTFLEGTAQRLYAFVRGADGHLHVNFWDGSQWRWADQGRPPGASVFAGPTATTYRDANVQRLYVFVRDAPSRLFVNFWDGSTWRWAEQGVPATGRVRRPFDVVTYFEAGTRRIYSFVDDDQERLQLNYWNGSTWLWADTWQPWTFDWGSIDYFQPDVAQGGRAVAVAVHPADDRRILVASDTGGLFRSADRGRSWAHIRNLPTQWLQDVEYAPDNPDVVIAVARADYRQPNGGGIWRSIDGGLSWAQPAGSVPPAGPRCPPRTGAWAVSFEPGANRVYVATDCGIAVSDSLGVGWRHVVLDATTPANAELTQDRVWSVLARRGGHANAAADNGIWYRQSLGSWTRASNGPSQGQGGVAHAFAASPLDGDQLFLVAGGNRLFQSLDGGRNWTNAAGLPKVYAFLRGADNELHADRWAGRQWEWGDHDAPMTSQVTGTPAVVAYQNGRMYAFVHGSDGRIYIRYGNEEGWEWSDQGTPPATTAIDSPAAVAFPDRIMGFTRTSAGGLAKNEWNEATGWSWRNQGTPPGTQASGRPSVITYDDGTRRVYAFTAGSNGRLFVNFWDGSTWRWADQGTPPGTTMTGSPDAITYRDGAQRIYTFVRGANGHLFVNYWDGGNWRWADQGLPPDTTVADVPGTISYRDGAQRIYAFVRGANGRLYVNFWNGSVWQWADQGPPPGTTAANAPVAVAYFNDAQLIYAFVRGANDRLFTNWWNGSTWQWVDLGTPSGSTVAAAPGLIVFDDLGRWGRPGFVRTAPAASGDADRFDLWFGDGVDVLKGTYASAAGGPRNVSWSLPASDHADPADVGFDSTAARRPLLLASDGGLHVTLDGGASWTLAGASRSGYHALQITEAMGQLVGVTGTATPPHLDLYYGTQDNHVFASPDSGRTWPRSAGGEGFFLRGARQFASHGGGNKITFVYCGPPCVNAIADPHFARVEGFPLPPDDDPVDDDGAEGNPIFLRQGAYVQRTVDNDATTPTDSIYKLTRSTGASWTTRYTIPQPPWGLASVAGDSANPTLYQAVVRPGQTPDGLEQLGLTRISNVLGAGTAAVADADGVGFGSLGIFPTEFAWYPVFAVSPTEPSFLIAADIVDDRMKTSIDSGLTWTPNDELTRHVTRDGTIQFRDRRFTAASTIAVSPLNGRHVLVGTVQGGIVRSTDHGATWQRLAGSEMLPQISSFFFEDDTHLVVSTYGRGLWRVNLTGATVAAAGAAAAPATTPAPARLPRSEPLVVDPTTGSFVRLDTFEVRRMCPTCRYIVAPEGEITDVQMTGLEVRSVKLSAGTLMAFDADRQVAAVPPTMPFALDRTMGAFGGNRIAAQLRDQQLPIRGLVLDGAELKGVIVSPEPIDLDRPPAPVLYLETRDTMTGLAKAEPNETVTARGQRFEPDPNAPVVLKIGDREAARAQVEADGTFTATFVVREFPGDYVVVAEQAAARGALVAKLTLKVTRRDRQ